MNHAKHKVRSDHVQNGFTRADLLAMVFTLAMVALVFLPAWARTRARPQAAQCLYNLRQLALGWQMYANDSNGRLAANHGSFPANYDYTATAPNWVAGRLDYQGGNQTIPGQPDDLNAALLVDPAHSEMGPYVHNPALFRCPADQSQYGTQPRVRSYSMNCAVGSTANGTAVDGTHVAGHWLSTGNANAPGGSPFRIYLKDSDLRGTLSPAGLFVFLEEHPDSINDGAFQFEMPIGWPNGSPAAYTFIDMPAKNHNNNACGFSFADGHGELHAWARPDLLPNPTYAPGSLGGLLSFANDPDVAWVASHSTTLTSQ